MMNDRGKSDRSIVPEKLPNKADHNAAEVAEERDRAKGNPAKRDKPWTLSQPGLPSALERVGQAARQDRRLRFTALLHHIYDEDRLRRAYMAVEHDAAAGIDGETWRHYGENLKDNLQDLSGRLARGA
jgi:RNA-directed DNA polymerase